MKKLRNLLGLFLAILLVGMFAACEGPEGPAGPKGDPGDPADPFVNWEGFKEGIVCADCHNPDYDTTYYVWGRKYQWEFSKHAAGGDYERNTNQCSNCHTTEGYMQMVNGKTVTSHVNGTPPGCFSCHAPHSRADFSLRTVEPVTILSAVAGVPDYVFDYGKGNQCVSCHKTRAMTLPNAPEPDPSKILITDTITIKTNRWYPHYGVQGQMLAGVGGFEFQGKTYSSSLHTMSTVIKDEGCIICHMADPPAGQGVGGGGHTMNIEYENYQGNTTYLLTGCTVAGCHASPNFTIDYKQSQTRTHELLDSLYTLLTPPIRNWINPSTGLVNASATSPLKIAPEYLSGALFNYYFVEHDLSFGSHNTQYAQQLLEHSIEVLTAE